MLKNLVLQHGKQKINSLTKYPSILTLHKLGQKGRLTSEWATDIQGETMFATEKIDGTNVRIICLGNEYLVGSREFLRERRDDGDRIGKAEGRHEQGGGEAEAREGHASSWIFL